MHYILGIMVVWSTHFSINNALLDAQHRLFLEKISQLEQAGIEGESEEVITDLLQFLIDYAQRHFTDEEAYMAAHHYPHLEEHQEIHHAFKKVAKNYQKQLKQEGASPQLAHSAAIFMETWLTNHILEEDQAVANYIQHHQHK